MKHLLISCALLAFCLSTPAFSQEEATTLQAQAAEIKDESSSKLKIKVDIDDEVADDEKISKITDLIGKFDAEAAKELDIELKALSDEDKAKLVDKIDNGFSFDSSSDRVPAGAVLIALPAVLLIFGMPLFLLIALLSYGHRKRKQKMELIQLYISSDRDIPEHVITGLDNGGSANSLKSGLTLTAVGLGVVSAFNALGNSEAGALGLIPMFLGIARLVFWYLVERKADSESQAEQ